MGLESGFQIAPNWPCEKMTMTSQFANMTSSSNFFNIILYCWSQFYVKIITGSGVMTIFFYKGLTRNLQIRYTLVWVLPNIWRLGQVRDTKFGKNVPNEMLLNAAKCQGYSFYHFGVIKGKPTRGVKLTPAPPRLGLSLYDCRNPQKSNSV